MDRDDTMYNYNGDAVCDYEEFQAPAISAVSKNRSWLVGVLCGSAAVALATLGLVALQKSKARRTRSDLV
jgi:hypothetical protein